MNPEVTLLACIALPLLLAALIAALYRWPNPREAASLLGAGSLFILVCSFYRDVLDGARPSITLLEPMRGLTIGFEVEPLGLLFALLASFLWLVTSVYSIGYMRSHNERHQTRFYASFAVALGSTMGIAFAANLFTLFIFYELLTLSTYPLVTHAGSHAARRSGRIYLGYLLGTSIILLLLALAWTWSVAGTLDFREGGILQGNITPAAAGILLALYVFGTGKAAVMPMHRWLPAAMVAPTPVSALLHAVAVVKAGVFTILKVVVYIFGIDFAAEIPLAVLLLYAAAATILLASVLALRQDNLKLRLACSTISHLSYITLGALLATPAGIVGGGMHIVMHAFAKITLFFCAGAILVATHKTHVSEMDGLGRRMPVTMAAFLVASLSIIGLPPLGGFWSKWYLGLGTLDAQQLAMLGVLLAGSLLNIAYLLPIPMRAFFNREHGNDAATATKKAPVACVTALALTATACIVLFFTPEPLYNLLQQLITRQE